MLLYLFPKSKYSSSQEELKMKPKYTDGEMEELVEMGNELREARQKFGFTQEEFAKILGASTTTLTQWEKGKLRAVGANKKRIRMCWSITNNQRVLGVIQHLKTLDDGGPAIAGLLGMLLTLSEYSGFGSGAINLFVVPDSPLVNAVQELAKGIRSDYLNHFQKEKK